MLERVAFDGSVMASSGGSLTPDEFRQVGMTPRVIQGKL